MDAEIIKKYYGGGRLHLQAWTGLDYKELDEIRDSQTGRSCVYYNGHECCMEYLNDSQVRLSRDGENYGVFSLVSRF